MGGVEAFPSGNIGSPSLLLLARIDKRLSFFGFQEEALLKSCIFVLVLRDNIFMDLSATSQSVINQQ